MICVFFSFGAQEGLNSLSPGRCRGREVLSLLIFIAHEDQMA